MSERVIDVRGKACPQPVIETRKILLEGTAESLRVIVDNRASAENVSRMVRSLGQEIRIDREEPGEIHLMINLGGTSGGDTKVANGSTMTSAVMSPPAASSATQSAEDLCRQPSRNVVLISSDRFGSGEEELGRILMRSFIKTLSEVVPKPEAILFVNSGVYWTIEGSDLLEEIQRLADTGVQILSCGTCLDYYHLKEKLAVGVVTNMFEVVSLLASADRVLRP
ncbi:sulfurtransferase-like selenium metabolism protein YedF [Candidatus Eisenbacteria bacterium]|uniref:Sulfurtransferase-like selenium metabolism protein YedF n=1 Tax=Eiseniibacteriota bacterium TaxID=2212470 RepID=A0ABV6YKM2_UNCEI